MLEASLTVSKTRNAPQLTEPLLPIPQDPASRTRTEDTRALFKNAEPKINPESGEPMELEPPNEYEGEDVVELATLMEAVGAGLTRSEVGGGGDFPCTYIVGTLDCVSFFQFIDVCPIPLPFLCRCTLWR